MGRPTLSFWTSLTLPFRRSAKAGSHAQALLGSSSTPSVSGSRGAPRKSWFRIVASQLHIFLGFLWIVPAIFILVLNYRRTIIGASIGCVRCKRTVYLSAATRSKLSHDDHNALGALQVASKAFEVWFMFVAASLVYDVTMFMAERKGKFIPIGFLTTYLEFGDLRYFCTSSPWTTPFQPRPVPGKGRGWRSTLVLYGFLLFVIAMSVTANLMGPGSAVLMIPTLQFRNATYEHGPVLKELAMAKQPSNPSMLINCTTEELLVGNYTCVSGTYGMTMDGLLTGAFASYKQSSEWAISSGLSVEGAVTLLFNQSCSALDHDDGCQLFSSPNRQVLRNISSDTHRFRTDSFAGNLAPPLNSSLQTILHRMGPSIAQNVSCLFSNTSAVTIAEDRTVRCYSMWGSDFCIPVGRGWSYGNSNSSFSIISLDEAIGNTTVSIYSSEVAVNRSLAGRRCGADDEPCWNSEFAGKRDTTIANITITEFRNSSVWAESMLFCVGWFYPSYSHYELDTSHTNDINLARITSSSQDTAAPQRVHPDWLLAAWSVGRGGAAISKAAEVVSAAISLVYDTQEKGDEGLEEVVSYFKFLQQLVFSQAMSLVDFTTTPRDSFTGGATPKVFALDDWAAIHVYAYGIESRTSLMGVFVVSVGIVSALLRTITAIMRRERTKSAFELLTVALRQQYDVRFDEKREEAEMARVRVGVKRPPRYRGKKGMDLVFEGGVGEGELGGIGGHLGYHGGIGSGAQVNIQLTASPEPMSAGNEPVGR
ncbi:MAG: hypothetical protein M1840_006385 [Geoglossum simile]|nr:MAG: hypothetical protein M1840_006385 [Geoglossum simile]